MIQKNKIAGGINKPLELHNSYAQKILTTAIVLIGSFWYHAWYEPIFY